MALLSAAFVEATLTPEARPDTWSNLGHEEAETVIANVTFTAKRTGMENWQIIHSAEEVPKMIVEGCFAIPDGHIFAPQDVLDVSKDGSFSIPRSGRGSLRTINKTDLSEQEWQKTQALLVKKKALPTPNAEKMDQALIPRPAMPANSSELSTDIKEDTEELKSFIDSLPNYSLDKARLKDHVNQLAKKANIAPKYLIFLPQGVQFYDQTGTIVLYDIKTLEKIK
ncbi:UNVERIFIED_CONTAM: pneumococcal-type histidine triad protein [Streptococcus canis]|nr:pneumococcal-type histidine triad protein [Streptococcus canis]QKG74950.1 pneumococcal-type histidine triad protein [Streptococcus canis]GMX35301.1 hypothetical protein SpKU43_03790 [Streptococcus canis]GMX39174.1 hypothetical protein ScKU71_03970 [Streptococcus canis]